MVKAAEMNPFGPVQEQATPGVAEAVAVKFKVTPSQIGELDPAVVKGIGFTVTVDVAVPEHPFVVPVTVQTVVPTAGETEYGLTVETAKVAP